MGAEDTTEETTKAESTTETGSSGKDTGKGDEKAKDGGSAAAKETKATDDTAGLKSALQKERKLREAAEKTIRDGELAKLPELERYKTLSDELTKENQQLKLDNMRRQVAMEMNLPWSLGKRLTGDTEEEMRSDAADLAQNYKADHAHRGLPEDKNNRRPKDDSKKSGKTGSPTMNDAFRALAGRNRL